MTDTSEPAAPAAPGFPRGMVPSPERVAWLALDDVAPSPENPRQRFDAEGLAELAESIRAHGVLEPVLVRPLPPPIIPDPAAETTLGAFVNASEGPRYVLVAGERRWRAARLAGLTHVPALVREGLSDEDALRLALVENLQRRDLDPLEEAAGYRRLQELGLKQAQVAAAVHRSQPAVANALRLLDLPEEVREAIQDGRLSPAHGRALAGYKAFPTLQRTLATLAEKEQWPSKRLEDKECVGAYRLEEAGVVKRMGYGAPFDVAVCQKCPFDAYRTLPVGGAVCLRPAHYAELAAAAEAERAARTRAAVEEAQRAGTTLPKLSELGYGAYERLDSPSRVPAGCTPEGCPCRGQALDGYSNEVVAICTDPRRYRKLRAADTRAANAERQAWREAVLARLDARLERLTEPVNVTGRELAVLALLALQIVHGAGSTEVLRAAVKRHGGDGTPNLEAARLAAVRRWDAQGMRRALAVLGALDVATVARVVLAAAVRDELTTWEGHPELARWLGVVDDAGAGGAAAPGERPGDPTRAGATGEAIEAGEAAPG